MKKFLRKLLPTIVMLAVSATLVGTSTFAWFSMNNRVTVTGMTVKTKVSSNLLIAKDDLTSTSIRPENEFTSSIEQSVKGFLEPVSTYDAIHFFYTNDAKADGSYNKIGSEAFIEYTGAATSNADYADAFSEYYGVTKSDASAFPGQKAVPYVDYVFQLKASNTKSSGEQYIVVQKLLLKYMGEEPNNGTAHRVAFFVADITNGSVSSSATGSSSTYKVESSANFDNKGRDPATNSSATSGAVVYATNDYKTAEYVNTTTNQLATVQHGETRYYKVVVRMWLEGQDTTCDNETYMELTNSWELELRLELVDVNNGTTYINQSDSSGVL